MAGESLSEKIIAILPLLILGLGLSDLFLDTLPGVPFFLVFIIGFAVVLPIVAILLNVDEEEEDASLDEVGRTIEGTFDRLGESLDRVFGGGQYERREGDHRDHHGDPSPPTTEQNTRDAIETLRNRYARGELTDEQFESKLDRLMETDTPENAAAWRQRERANERERERDTTR